MFENPRRGRQARNSTKNVPKILDLKSPSEQIFSENCRWVPPKDESSESCLVWKVSLSFNYAVQGGSLLAFVDKNSTSCSFQNLNVHWLKGVLSMTKFVLFLQGRSTPVKGKSRILSTFAEWDWLPNAAKQIENLLNSFLSKGWWKRRRLGWPVCDLVVIKVTEIQKGFPLIALELFHYIKIFVGSVFRLKSVEKG